MGTFFFTSSDGTRIRGWRNGGEGPLVLLIPGLGTTPQSFPGLTDPDCGFDVISFYQRGTFGSEKPAEEESIRVEHHAEDAAALMDTLGVDQAIVVAWSLGVNSAFDLAVSAPERVRGVLAVGGVPGGTLDTMFAGLPVPSQVRRLTNRGLLGALRVAGPVLSEVSRRVPVNNATSHLVTRTGFIKPRGEIAHLTELLEEFLRSDWRWFFTLALAGAEHMAMDVAHLRIPITFIAASQDLLTSRDAIQKVANGLPQARVHVVEGSHYIGLEHPEVVLTELSTLATVADEAEEAARRRSQVAG